MESVRHTRPEPEAWPELIDLTQQVLPKHAIGLYPGALKVARRVEELSYFELDQNNYYGMGKLMCGLAQQLQNPDVRDDVTTRMAVGLVRQAYKKRDLPKKEPYQPVVGDLFEDTPLALPFFDPTTVAWKRMAPAEKLLLKTLSNTAIAKRRIDVKFGPGSLRSKVWRRVQPHVVGLSAYISSPVASVAGSSTTGPTALWQAHLLGAPLGEPLTSEQAVIPIDMARVKKLAKQPAHFTRTARLRQDEFFAGVGWSKV